MLLIIITTYASSTGFCIKLQKIPFPRDIEKTTFAGTLPVTRLSTLKD